MPYKQSQSLTLTFVADKEGVLNLVDCSPNNSLSDVEWANDE